MLPDERQRNMRVWMSRNSCVNSACAIGNIVAKRQQNAMIEAILHQYPIFYATTETMLFSLMSKSMQQNRAATKREPARHSLIHPEPKSDPLHLLCPCFSMRSVITGGTLLLKKTPRQRDL